MDKVKPCNRSYPCGRSLPGRMSSHVVDALPEAEEAAHSTAKLASLCDYSDDEDEEEAEVEGDGQVYEDGKDSMVEEAEENADIEVRQHSESKKKKNKRAEDSSNTKKFFCVKCGKGFQSQKAVCGHMACHSEKDKRLNNPAAHHSKNKPSWFNQRAAMDSHSDNENYSAAAGPGTSSRRRSKRVKYKSNEVKPDFSVPDYNGGSSVSVVENEQEEVAKCLMMLSRDSCKWGRYKFKSVGDSSELSVKMEDRSRSKASGGKIGVRLKPLRTAPDTELAKELRNKTVNDSCISFNESDENSVEANATPTSDLRKGKGETGKSGSKRVKHECLVCLKGFRSGQALGGHERVHLTGVSDELKPVNEEIPLQDSSSQARSCNDLNRLAPVEDHEFMPW